MNIFYDENMPFAQAFFGDLGQLHAFVGRELTAQQTKSADVLLVRSITKVNQALLASNSTCQFVGTATIGVDHIDQNYLSERGITFTSAPGCNAISVAEYVISALVVLAERYLIDLLSLTIGIVGGGNTGTRLSEKLSALGIKALICDPILEAQQKKNSKDKHHYSSLEDVLSCDVVSLHVPIVENGDHPTFHLLNENRLKQLNDHQILINACRGEVIDNKALLALKKQGHGVKLVLDVWENEPNILHELIAYTEISSAHIAGYSLEGKARGTEILYQALCKQLEIPVDKQLSDFLPRASITEVEINQPFEQILLNQLVKMVYDVRRDDGIFRQTVLSHGFDHIRKTYPARREFSSVKVTMSNQAKSDVPHHLGFLKQ
ncbi:MULTISPECIES: 4-phosphoerythronate dehydrogenase [unclassified Colwellia]|uniref:4-phosphoerythronate dehydrogenase n=1 Tax=unclassified Colwellia TaxID=196834 RepID=UPI0015F6282C|nr:MULTISPECIES: 4-phosphoerythronate dehydrogenase [unclassified Colwellia]MBA6231760.1 4-phosphoerythronate dehydrogenase [Colwellia sp. MB02u-7]MBA6235715.1 4-phosphoerythronate dehydrogenase [Colwellia sp. MB02u-11]MBA6254786.1 4-phosphoerythronate dehydrogenase [Colwellia sp. MB3u-28]MBA6259289.1 4-phosphoerythronate dehydrogenase [Colwellia sp. MB3u-41]MBA6298804.1 4-phosphoerythronate dehydrogenase [Colwellia sp. MB3u-22]